MLKFNDEELFELAAALDSPFHALDQHIEFIAKQTQTEIICVTKGKFGAVLYHYGEWFYNSGYQIEVRDTVGAGKTGVAHWKAATKPLRNDSQLYDCTPDGFHQFLKSIKARADTYGWSKPGGGVPLVSTKPR